MEPSYPFVKEPLSTWACGMIVVFVPMLVITLFQLNMRSILDFHDGFTGTLKAAAALLQGFPSGHTTSACASSVFLNLYSNAKLKAFGDHASDLWTIKVQGQAAAAYHPVMWNLWAQSSTTAQAQKMRLSWLRNMGCLEVIVQDKNLLLRLRKQK
ncbi:lipid phosphate phosphatase 1 [Diplocarpon mali]|nr:lipid phosphate phosphatase 1 [Diplocarpon mali]